MQNVALQYIQHFLNLLRYSPFIHGKCLSKGVLSFVPIHPEFLGSSLTCIHIPEIYLNIWFNTV